MDLQKLVQPILVVTEGSHEDAVLASATASIKAFKESNPVWKEWLAGPFTKTVRRIKPKDYSKIVDLLKENCLGLDWVTVTVRDSQVIAFSPLKYEDFPKFLRRAQVSLELPRNYSLDTLESVQSVSSPKLIVNDDLKMSTGKECAQVSHGLWMLFLEDSSFDKPVEVLRVSDTVFSELKESADKVVRDNGLTEFDGPTDTVLVNF